MIILQQQLVPQQMHHISGSSAPNLVAANGAPINKLVHHAQIPGAMKQMPRRSLLLEVRIKGLCFENERVYS